jgi:hypothetical protein
MRVLFLKIHFHVFKGIVSRDGVSTETIGVKFMPKQSAAYVSCMWKVARQKFMTQKNRRPVVFKWRVLAPRSNCPQNATNRAGVLGLWRSALKHSAECQPPLSNKLRNANSEVKFAHGMPQTWRLCS